ncbi:pyridoxamine 5'-phosphate oxidase family protein [Actinomarinicola tropica]|uniref:Pyridoxamine 5'-phosphate oxidase family protein n=1 Tax=Actinomarinicola tropica TaxID=2789776 RepID=A0A5Q2RLQ5_9ACTN|nr:pyridoxamine 5'-phosphate oxidase family protein [Actinomarinicola tropica]QGG96414.1 pyridoxamine 5'-phosphate oxidase family protein [Actinomarinicola tropica]
MDTTTSPTPETRLDPRFSSPGAAPRDWQEALGIILDAGVSWLSTVRADGRPHVTPLIAVWHDAALHFCTGTEEQKRRNLDHEPRCVLTTGCNRFDEGLDVVVEGTAERVVDDVVLHVLADAWVAQHGEHWRFAVRDGSFWNDVGGEAHVFRVRPTTAFGFGKGEPFSMTRWRFDA